MKLYNVFLGELNENLEEDYPPSFNMEEFKALNSFNSRISYCEEHLKRIASGSARIVYQIDDEKVLKLAKNKRGLAQNEIEITHGKYHDLKDIVAKVFDYHQNDLWVEMELARKVRVADFKRITGFNFKEFSSVLLKYGNESNPQLNRYKPNGVSKELYEVAWEDEFVSDILRYIGNFGLPVGDLTRLNSYGLVKRYGGDYIVLIDYGLTEDVYTSYYN